MGCNLSGVGEGRGREAAGASAPAASGTGLVPSTTTGTPPAGRPSEWFLIDRRACRLKRMKKGVLNASRLLDFDAAGEKCRMRRTFVTLTYRPGVEWSPDHVGKFRRCMREWFARRGVVCRFAWVAELTKAGRMHYHLLVWVPRRFILPKADRRGWWPHGSTNVQEARSAIGYLAKYASKGTPEGHEFPKGARIHGCGGLTSDGKRERRYWLAPLFARDALGGRADIRKIRGGYADRITGEFTPSPWQIWAPRGGGVWAWRFLPEQIAC